jgi:hypothetical protein
MYFKFVKKCQEISAGKSVPPASKKVGRGIFPSHLPRWDRFLAEPDAEARHAHAEQVSAGTRHKKQTVSPRARLRETGLAQRAATTRQAEPKLKARA